MKLLNKFSKWRTPGKLLLLLLLALLLVGGPALASSGGSFDLSWWTVDGGGGTSNGGSYALSGTVGQADASEPLSGGSYALTGGFWAGPGGGDWSTDVVITGPIVGEVGTTYAFTATVAPITTTTPITYSWVVDDQAPVVNVVGGVQDTIDLSWAEDGNHTITVTIDNGVGTATSVHDIMLYVLPTEVVITGPIAGEVGTTYAFTATVSPVTTTTPITYSWVVDDQAPVVNVVGGVQDAIDLSWADGGTHTITVTIDNGVGTVTSVDHIITLKYMTFLPMIAKP